jgi:hypothetical protein
VAVFRRLPLPLEHCISTTTIRGGSLSSCNALPACSLSSQYGSFPSRLGSIWPTDAKRRLWLSLLSITAMETPTHALSVSKSRRCVKELSRMVSTRLGGTVSVQKSILGRPRRLLWYRPGLLTWHTPPCRSPSVPHAHWTVADVPGPDDLHFWTVFGQWFGLFQRGYLQRYGCHHRRRSARL